MATRERSLHGGHVFVVKPEVIERLGVEASVVELKPSPAEAAATLKAEKVAAAAEAAASTAAAAAAASAGGDDNGGASTPGSGRKVGGCVSGDRSPCGLMALSVELL